MHPLALEVAFEETYPPFAHVAGGPLNAEVDAKGYQWSQGEVRASARGHGVVGFRIRA